MDLGKSYLIWYLWAWNSTNWTYFLQTVFLEPDFSNQISRTSFLEPLFYTYLEKWLQNKWFNGKTLGECSNLTSILIHFSFRKSRERKRNVFFYNQSTYKLHVGGLFPYIIDYTRAELRKIYIASKWLLVWFCIKIIVYIISFQLWSFGPKCHILKESHFILRIQCKPGLSGF